MKRYKKWIALALGFIIALFMGSSIKVTPITNRAIVVGLAVDVAEGDKIEITTQILMLTSQSSSQMESKEISAISATVADALSRISQNTSMDISLAHCNFVVLGEKLLEKNAFYPLDYLLRNAYLSENALLVGAYGTAKDVLSAKMAFSEMSSFYAERTLEAHAEYEDLTLKTIKDFIVERQKVNPSNFLTMVKKVPLETSLEETVSSEQGGGSATEGQDEQEYYFTMTDTAVLQGDSLVGFLGSQETIGLNLVKGMVSKGSVEISSDSGSVLDLYLVNCKSKTSCDKDTAKLTVEIKATAILKEVNLPDGISDKLVLTLTDEELAEAERYYADAVTNCYLTCKAWGVDIYDITGTMYRRYHIENYPLESTSIEANVKFAVE